MSSCQSHPIARRRNARHAFAMKKSLGKIKFFLGESVGHIAATVLLVWAYYKADIIGLYLPITSGDAITAFLVSISFLAYFLSKSYAELSPTPGWKQVWTIICVALFISFGFGSGIGEYKYDQYDNEIKRSREEVARTYFIPLLIILAPALIGTSHGIKKKRKLKKQLSESLDIGERLREANNLLTRQSNTPLKRHKRFSGA